MPYSVRRVCGYQSEGNSQHSLKGKKSWEKWRVLEQEAQSPLEVGNGHRFCVAKSERDCRAVEQQGSCCAAWESRYQVGRARKPDQPLDKADSPRSPAWAQGDSVGNGQGRTLHFLEPEAEDREEPTFLNQTDSRKVKKVALEKVQGSLKPKDKI